MRRYIGRWRRNKITSLQVGVQYMTKSFHPPPLAAIIPPWWKLPVWVQANNIPSSRLFGSQRGSAPHNNSEAEVTCWTATPGWESSSLFEFNLLSNTGRHHSALHWTPPPFMVITVCTVGLGGNCRGDLNTRPRHHRLSSLTTVWSFSVPVTITGLDFIASFFLKYGRSFGRH